MKLDKFNLNETQLNLLDTLIYEEKDLPFLRQQIKKYIELNYPLEVLVNNWVEIRKLGRDSSSLKSFRIRYGSELGDKLFAEKCKSSTKTKEYYIEKYGEEEAKKD